MNPKTLSLSYYQHHDVLFLSRDLLGKFLITQIDGVITGGMIIETEAYRGPEDKASHAYGGRRTKRNEPMYGKGGSCYVYLCYGIHLLFNIVTHSVGVPHAILIRAIHPEIGIPTMLQRREKKKLEKSLTAGPGSVCKALGIGLQHNGLFLDNSTIWIEDRHIKPDASQIEIGPRIGIDYAAEDADLPWRFRFLLNGGL
jgi:DNA-3-methyladenine glycosylase